MIDSSAPPPLKVKPKYGELLAGRSSKDIDLTLRDCNIPEEELLTICSLASPPAKHRTDAPITKIPADSPPDSSISLYQTPLGVRSSDPFSLMQEELKPPSGGPEEPHQQKSSSPAQISQRRRQRHDLFLKKETERKFLPSPTARPHLSLLSCEPPPPPHQPSDSTFFSPYHVRLFLQLQAVLLHQ